MATKLDRPRPATKLGLASDVRSKDYLTRAERGAKPKKARSIKSRAAKSAGVRR